MRTRAVPAFEWKHRAQTILFDNILDEEELKDLLNFKKMVEEGQGRAGGEKYQPTVEDTSRQRSVRQKKTGTRKTGTKRTEAGQQNEVVVFRE
jgi:murein L,D-transpeptidase YafK